MALNVRDNATEKHTPPIIPVYLTYGIGRGATSEIALDMRNNWWGSSLGPYEPERHADGRGEAVGDNIEFAPWLTASRPGPDADSLHLRYLQVRRKTQKSILSVHTLAL